MSSNGTTIKKAKSKDVCDAVLYSSKLIASGYNVHVQEAEYTIHAIIHHSINLLLQLFDYRVRLLVTACDEEKCTSLIQ